MGLWQIDTDTLARSRFVLSPFAEAFASLRLLYAGTARPEHGPDRGITGCVPQSYAEEMIS